MKRLLLTCALILISAVSLIDVVTQSPAPASDDRSASSWYRGEKARLETALQHATPGSGRAFKVQSKLAKLENWRRDEPRMGYPEEFARILYERRIPADRSTPDYAPGYLYREVTKARSFPAPRTKNLIWQPRGPGNVAGRARTIVVDPDDASGDTWFVASVGGGVWWTTDAGANWTQLMDDQPLLAMQSLAMAPSSTNILYAGTGESYFNVDTMNGNGMLKSTDKGETWTPLTSTLDDPRFNNVSRIIVSPTDPNLVLASTTVGRYKSELTPMTYIFRSVDGGATWNEVFAEVNSGSISGARVQQLLADPTNFNIQYATVHETGLLKSTDAGLSWNYINVGITDLTGRFEMAISPVSSSYLYVSSEGEFDSKLWFSWDAGATWNNMGNNGGSDQWLGAQGWYDNTIVCHPTDPAIVYVGGPQLYQLDLNIINNTYTSTPLASYSFPHPDHHWLEIVPEPGGNWYLLGSNDGGVTRTTSGATGFVSPINGMVTTQFYGVDKRPGASAYIGGMQDNGTWRSPLDPTATDNWTFDIGGDGYETSWHFDDPQKIMGGFQFNGLRRTLNGGVSWISATNGMSDTGGGNAPFITKIAKSWQRPDEVFAVGAQGVWRSTDFGASWTLSPVTLGEWGEISSFHDVRVSGADQDIVWAGSRMDADGDIMVSTDAGVTFNPTVDHAAVVMGRISGLATHPTEPNTAFALFSFAARPKILKTTDLGQTWSDLSGFGTGTTSSNGFPDVAVYDLLVWPNDPQHIWVGTEIGLVESLDGGANWALANNGLPAVGIWHLKAVEDEIIVGTHGRGIWSTTVPELEEGLTFNPLFEAMVQIPGGDLDLSFNLRSVYDSTQVWVDGTQIATYGANIRRQTETITLPVLASGTVSAFARSFRGASVYDSVTKQAEVFAMAEPVFTYLNELNDANDLPVVTDGFSWTTPGGFADPALHSVHDYADGANYTFTLLAPISIANVSTLTFREIAIVEPGEAGSEFGDFDFWDYVIVEGTSDGLVWRPVAAGWDARDSSDWLAAFNGGSGGDSSMYRTRTIVLNDTFAKGETVLLRWRLVADGAVAGWGWAVDDIAVTPSGGISAANDTPRAVTLGQNYPNPFNPSTTIRFSLPRAGDTRLQVYDTRGRLVRALIDGPRPAGTQSVVWDGRDDGGRGVASGVYLYRLIADEVVQQRKMTLVK